MGMVRYKEEQIIAKLRQAELLFANEKSIGQVSRILKVAPVK